MDVLTYLIVVIISQHVHISNHYVVHFKHTQFHINLISISRNFLILKKK